MFPERCRQREGGLVDSFSHHWDRTSASNFSCDGKVALLEDDKENLDNEEYFVCGYSIKRGVVILQGVGDELCPSKPIMIDSLVTFFSFRFTDDERISAARCANNKISGGSVIQPHHYSGQTNYLHHPQRGSAQTTVTHSKEKINNI